jgi:uncharacterized protein
VSRLEERGVPALGAVFLGVLVVAAWLGASRLVAWLSASIHHTVYAEGLARVQQSLGLSTLVQVMAMGTALAVGVRWFQPELRVQEALCLGPVRLRVLAACVVAGLALQFPLAELANILHDRVFGPEPLEDQLAIQRLLEAHSALEGVIVTTCLVAVVPLTEELLFRGLFYFGLSRRYGPGAGLVGSAILFGLAHLSPVPILYATAAGLVLGTVAGRTQSVWPGIALHAGVNAMPLLVPERVLPIPGFNVPSEAATHLAPSLLWPTLALAVAALCAVFALTRRTADDV